jgi:signal transduction histidine kinase/CheY-like chemotaxis protein
MAVLRRLLAVAALLFAAAATAALPPPWAEADFLIADSAVPPGADAAWSRQALPDEWHRTRPEFTGAAWYRFRADLAAAPEAVQALYLPRAGDRLTVFVNGRLVGSTAGPGGAAMNTWKRPLLFPLPPAALAAGTNVVHLRLEGVASHYSGLSVVALGPEAALREAYWTRFALQTVAPVGLAVALGLLGIFFLILWSRRREDTTYVLFGAASIVWGLRNVTDVLFHLAIPQPHWEIALATLYFLFVGLLCLFCLRFVEAALPRYERLLRGAMLAAPVLLYASLPWVPVLDATRFMHLCMLGFVAPPLWVVARTALLRRDPGAILVTLAGAVAFGFGAYDWLAVGRAGMFDSVRLVPYAALFFTTAVGWLLAHRFLLAYQGIEQLNAELDARVAQKSAELLSNMDSLARAKAEAEAANAAKSRFLAAASHDLRQPMHALGLFAAELAARERAPGNRDLAMRIGQSVRALETMFGELLDISRLDAGRVRAALRCFPLQEVFDRLETDFQPQAREKGLRLRVRPTRHWCESDPVLLERILRNLVANAIRYTERGGVIVACRARGSRLWLEVRDSGIGMSEAERGQVFEEYYQVGNPERDREKGSGLGLAIVRRLVEVLGERLVVKSAPGRGSLFALRARPVEAPTEAAAEAAAEAAEGRPLSFLQGRHLVALVEDDRLVRLAMESLLTGQGLTLASGADYAETREALRRLGRAPDLVIADYRLRGDETGVAVARRLRRDHGRDIPVLLLTGESAPEELADVGGEAFPVLRKPVGPERLFAEIAALLPPPEGAAQRQAAL